MTQAQLNDLSKAPFGRDYWKNNVFKSFSNIDFESDGVRNHPAGVRAQQAVASFERGVGADIQRIKMSMTLLATPGMEYAISCAARVSSFETYRERFDAVANSFRLKGQGIGFTAETNPVTGISETVDVTKVSAGINIAIGSNASAVAAAAGAPNLVK